MCNPSALEFGRASLAAGQVEGRDVLEVGALDVNGSLRALVESRGARSYLGVDIERGPGVDEVCRAEELVERYGPDSFDVVISTELVEHVRDWRPVMSNLKRVLRPGGTLLLTTRSAGFPYHGYPHDYWRYEPEDMRAIFADLEVERIEPDPDYPGVFVKARKPAGFREADLSELELFSVVKRARVRAVADREVALFRLAHAPGALLHRALPDRVRRLLPARARHALRRRLARQPE